MRKRLEQDSPARAIVQEELELLGRVHALLAGGRGPTGQGIAASDFERDLVALRDQIADEKPEDLPSLVEQMTRVSALAQGRRAGKAVLPLDAASPYFAHLRIKSEDKRGASKESALDILIGKKSLIDRNAGVQIVDWRDAPVSQVYYRYDEGDDYDEEVSGGSLRGVVLARRNLTIADGKLRRIGCPQGTFVASGEGEWFELEGDEVALLAGGQGTAARPPRPTLPARGRRRQVARATFDGNKALPEIAALIDRAQFSLITAPGAGLVVIQGGAGSGKTTVALHRIAFLVFAEPQHFRPSRCLFVVPSEALARYVAGVLPALGVSGVPVTTFASWARNLRRRLVPAAPDRYAEDTPPSVTRLKKHPGLIALVEAAVEVELGLVRQALAARIGDAPGAARLLEAWARPDERPPMARLGALRKSVARGAFELAPASAHIAEQELRAAERRLADARRILFELYTDRGRLAALSGADVREPASAREIEELVRRCGKQLEEAVPAELAGIDAERLQPIDGRPLDDGSDEDGARARLDREDDPLLLYLHQRVHGALTRVDGEPLVYDHIAIDEAQDLSAAEVKLLYSATPERRRSVTIAGDVAQRVIFDNAFSGWERLVADIGAGTSVGVRPLKLAYRSTAPVMRFAHRVLGPLAATESTDSEARPGAEVGLHAFPGMGEAVAFVADALRSLVGREPSASVALLTRHSGQADAWWGALLRAEVPSLRRVRRSEFAFAPGIDVTDVGQVKGLEFDYVILLDVNDTSYPDTVEARHLLHIGATRATHQLWLVATGPVSPLIEAALGDEVGQASGAR